MANFYNVMFIWFSVFTVCSFSMTAVTGGPTTDDDDQNVDNMAEYEEFADMESQSQGSAEKDCYFKAALNKCKKGKELLTTVVVDQRKAGQVTVTSTRSACLVGVCTKVKGKLTISKNIDIAGSGETVKPDEILKKGVSDNIYASSSECMEKGKPIVTIHCFKMKSPITNGGQIEEYEDELSNDDIMEMQANKKNDDTTDPNDDDSKMQDKDDTEDSDDDGTTAAAELQAADVPDDHEAYEQEVSLDELEASSQEGTTAKVQSYWTPYRGTFGRYCSHGYGLYLARSKHVRCYKDRKWHFRCKRVTHCRFNRCYWSGYRNNYDGYLNAHCNSNYIMVGIYSIFNKYYGDRRFQILCCSAPRYYTRQCYTSGFVNWFRQYMYYYVGGYKRVFTGMYSYHNNYHEDRRWRFASCNYRRCG